MEQNTSQEQAEWEKEFDGEPGAYFRTHHDEVGYAMLKDFIRNLLLSERTRLWDELEKMKPSDLQIGDAPGDQAVGSEYRAFGQNKGISDAQNIIKPKE